MTDSYIGVEVGGQFRIVEKIGAGGMSVVYKAEQPDMNRHVAIKILHSKYLSRPDLVARFRREARAMSQLSHPNTARVFLYGQLDDGACYFVMEYLDGRNLAKVIRRTGGIDCVRAVKIMTQVCYALEEAHRAGIVHRDLKPENIFLTTQGGIDDFPKVLDFGLAKVTERQMRPESLVLTQQGMVFGTPEFMSPEQAHGKTLDARSDTYSLGVVLYELITGKLPFDAKQPLDFIRMHVKEPPIPLSERRRDLNLPPALEAAVMRSLEKDPARRFQCAADLAEALEAAIDNRTSSDASPPFSGIATGGLPSMQSAQSDLRSSAQTPQHSSKSANGGPFAASGSAGSGGSAGSRSAGSGSSSEAQLHAGQAGAAGGAGASSQNKDNARANDGLGVSAGAAKPASNPSRAGMATWVWVVVSMCAGAAVAWVVSSFVR